jgi:two-component system, LytTR family, response regulator
MKPTCLIIDDEPVAAQGLAEDLNTLDVFTISGIAHSAEQALATCRTNQVDILFLDIQMPGLNGLQLLQSLSAKPLVILVTAYQQYALDGYEHGVVDYLLKPVSPARLKLACEKALERHAFRPTADHLYKKCNGRYIRIEHSAITYVEAANNYVLIHTPEEKYMVYQSLKTLEEELPRQWFVQVHKSFVIGKRHIKQVGPNTVVIRDVSIPLSRRFKTAFLQELEVKPFTRKG